MNRTRMIFQGHRSAALSHKGPGGCVPDGSGNRSTGGISPIWLLLLLGGVIYASLLPFAFDISGLGGAGVPGLSRITIAAAETNPEDILTNLLVYVPVGVAVVFSRISRRRSWITRFVLAAAVGIGISVLVEAMQTAIPQRVASWIDVWRNAIGVALGALLGAVLSDTARRATPFMRKIWLDRPFRTSARVLMIALFLYGIFPFDFVTDAAGLQASLGRARLDLAGVRHPGLIGSPFAPLVAQLMSAAWFVAIAYVSALAAREGRQERTWARAVTSGTLLICAIEVAQLFTKSHVFDIATIVLRVLSVMLGAWCALFVHDGLVASRRSRGSNRIGLTLLLGVLALSQLLSVVFTSTDPRAWFTERVDIARTQWVPFEALWREPMSQAAATALSMTVVYGAFAMTLVLLIGRARRGEIGRRADRWIIPCAGVTLVACFVEAAQLTTRTGTPDVTVPILALLASVAAVRLDPPLRRALAIRRSQTR